MVAADSVILAGVSAYSVDWILAGGGVGVGVDWEVLASLTRSLMFEVAELNVAALLFALKVVKVSFVNPDIISNLFFENSLLLEST